MLQHSVLMTSFLLIAAGYVAQVGHKPTAPPKGASLEEHLAFLGLKKPTLANAKQKETKPTEHAISSDFSSRVKGA